MVVLSLCIIKIYEKIDIDNYKISIYFSLLFEVVVIIYICICKYWVYVILSKY